MAGLTVTRRDIGPGHIVFTRSNDEVFQLVWSERGHASLNHSDCPDGIDLDVSISDKPARAEELIFAYPDYLPQRSSAS